MTDPGERWRQCYLSVCELRCKRAGNLCTRPMDVSLKAVMHRQVLRDVLAG